VFHAVGCYQDKLSFQGKGLGFGKIPEGALLFLGQLPPERNAGVEELAV
jgi:hypothetical protein